MARKKKDATDEGGSFSEDQATEETQETEETEPIDAPVRMGHRDALESIVANRNKQFEEETGIKPEDVEPEPEVEGKKQEPEEPEETEEPEKVDKKLEPKKKPEPETVEDEDTEIVVEGEKKKVKLSQVVEAGKRALQKESAADKRLQEATEKLKLIDQKLADLENISKQTQPPKDETEGVEKETSRDIDLNQLADELVHAQNYGTDEEAKEATIKLLKAVQGVGQPATVDEEALVSKAIERIDSRDQQKKHQAIFNRFQLSPEEGGFKDLLDDPRLFNYVKTEVDHLIGVEKMPDEWETYQKAGETIRKAFGKSVEPGTKPTSTEVADLTEKRERKRAQLDSIKTASAKTESSIKAEKPKSNAEIIEDMRRARPGQRV